jgi:ankyrin repeat protein
MSEIEWSEQLTELVRSNQLDELRQTLASNESARDSLSSIDEGIYNIVLLSAIKEGNIEAISILIEMGADVNVEPERFRSSPLIEACKVGNKEVVMHLLSRGAETSTTSKGETVIHFAALWGNLDMLKLFVDRGDGSFVHLPDKYGSTPLNHACHGGHHEVVKYLVALKVPINVQDTRGYTPLHTAVNKRHEDVSMYLLEQGADPNIPNCSGIVPLHRVCHYGQVQLFDTLLQDIYNTDVHAVDSKGVSALHWACKSGENHMISALLNRGVNPDLQDAGAKTALHIAVENANYHKTFGPVMLPINAGANVNIQDGYGYTPLHLAVRKKHFVDENLIRELLKVPVTMY